MSALLYTRNGPAGEDFGLLVPRGHRRPRPAIIWCPQAGGQGEFFLNPVSGDKIARSKLFHRMGQLGYVCATGDFGGSNLMGNNTATDRVKQVYDYLQTHPAVKPGRVHMVGTSMGVATAALFAKRFPGTVDGIVSFFGLTDPHALYAEDRGGMRNEFEAAWNVTYPTALPDAASPLRSAAELVADDVRWRSWTGADDPLILPSEGQAMADAMGGQHTTVPDANHDDTTIVQVAASELAEFFG